MERLAAAHEAINNGYFALAGPARGGGDGTRFRTPAAWPRGNARTMRAMTSRTPSNQPDPPSGSEKNGPGQARLDHAVEGAGPNRKVRRIELRVLIPVLIAALAVGAIVTFHFGGWGAVVVGGALILVYYVLGWSPVIGAAVARRKSGED